MATEIYVPIFMFFFFFGSLFAIASLLAPQELVLKANMAVMTLPFELLQGRLWPWLTASNDGKTLPSVFFSFIHFLTTYPFFFFPSFDLLTVAQLE